MPTGLPVRHERRQRVTAPRRPRLRRGGVAQPRRGRPGCAQRGMGAVPASVLPGFGCSVHAALL